MMTHTYIHTSQGVCEPSVSFQYSCLQSTTLKLQHTQVVGEREEGREGGATGGAKGVVPQVKLS